MRQRDTEEDRISMYADDSSTFKAWADMITCAREIIGRFEKASGGKLHDGKTIVMKIGKTRHVQMTSSQLGVEFRMMKDKEREGYLGDVIGHDVTEEERYGKILEEIEKIGQKWNRERIRHIWTSNSSKHTAAQQDQPQSISQHTEQQMRKKLKEKFGPSCGKDRRGEW